MNTDYRKASPPAVAYDLNGSGDDGESLAAGHCHEVASRGHRLQALGFYKKYDF